MIVLSAITLVVTILVAFTMAQDDTCTRYGFDIDIPGASCADIYNKNPTSHGRSGCNVLKTDHLFFAYCDMELDCGGTKGGQLVVTLLTFQQTPQATVRCVGWYGISEGKYECLLSICICTW